MTLIELYERLPASKHDSLKVINDQLIYDDGTKVYRALVDGKGSLVPLDAQTRDILAGL